MTIGAIRIQHVLALTIMALMCLALSAMIVFGLIHFIIVHRHAARQQSEFLQQSCYAVAVVMRSESTGDEESTCNLPVARHVL